MRGDWTLLCTASEQISSPVLLQERRHHVQNRSTPFVFLTVTMLAGGLLAGGCTGGGAGSSINSQGSGSVEIALQVGGATINTVNYTITGPASFTQNGVIDVSHSSTISAVLGPFAAGGGYAITLTGVSTDGSESCAGSGTFSVTAGQTASVTVPLTCHQAPRTGSVSVNGTVNVCPQNRFARRQPHRGVRGRSGRSGRQGARRRQRPVAAHGDLDGDLGRLHRASSLDTRFTCTAPGPATITLTVSDGDSSAGCAATSTVTVNCDTRPAAATCQLGNGAGAVKHVIYLQFDNTHLMRDKTNVASDLEQMPHLLNFIRGNGTMMAKTTRSSSRTPRAASCRR